MSGAKLSKKRDYWGSIHTHPHSVEVEHIPHWLVRWSDKRYVRVKVRPLATIHCWSLVRLLQCKINAIILHNLLSTVTIMLLIQKSSIIIKTDFIGPNQNNNQLLMNHYLIRYNHCSIKKKLKS